MSDFFFDDFFAQNDDPGLPVDIVFSSGIVPFYIKQRISLGDVEAAKEKAIIKHIKHDGSIEVVRVDEGVLTTEILARVIKSWPFKHRNGKTVPITPENIRALDASASEQLQQLASNLINQREKQVDPLEKNSAEA